MIANVALAMSKNYGELMAFRALQAAGSAATISNGMFASMKILCDDECSSDRGLGAGVVGDITTSA